jgi:hypothetical protein
MDLLKHKLSFINFSDLLSIVILTRLNFRCSEERMEGSYRLEIEILRRLRMTENVNSLITCYI